MKFDTWVEVPGMVLPGGTYLFVLADNKGAEHHVQIFDMVTRQLVAVVATDPEQLDKPKEENVALEPRQGPFRGEAVAEWYRPGSRVGEKFVYQPGSMIGEATIANLYDMSNVLKALQPGDTVLVVFKRADGEHRVTAVLGRRGQ